MTYGKDQAYGGAAAVSMPTSGISTVTYYMGIMRKRVVVFNQGSAASANTHNQTFVYDYTLGDRTGAYPLIVMNLCVSDTISVHLPGNGATLVTTVAPGRCKRFMLRANGQWTFQASLSYVKSFTDKASTPYQFMVYGQNTAPTNVANNFSPLSLSWTAKANRPSSGAQPTANDVSSTSTTNGQKGDRTVIHIDGVTTKEHDSSDTYSTRADAPYSFTTVGMGGFANGSPMFFGGRGLSSGVLDLRRYAEDTNTWGIPGAIPSFAHANATFAEVQLYGTLLAFSAENASKVSQVMLLESSSWSTFPTASNAMSYYNASIVPALGNSYKKTHVFGGDSAFAVDGFNVRSTNRTVDAETQTWRTGPQSPISPFSGHAGFVKGSVYYLLGGQWATVSSSLNQSHQSYNAYSEAYSVVGSRTWTSARFRHTARARINWMN